MVEALYRHNGGIPAALPFDAFDAKGDHWTDLANSPEGREACGYVEAPAVPDFDPETHAARWDMASEAWVVEVLPPPPPPGPSPVPDEVADWQFAAQAAIEGIITADEAEAWAGRGIVPKTLADAVAAQIQDPDQLFEVRMLLAGAKAYQRNNPLVPLLGAVFRKDAAGLDQFWRDASKRGVFSFAA